MNIDGLRPWEIAMADTEQLYWTKVIRAAWNEGRADGRDHAESMAEQKREAEQMRQVMRRR